MLTFSREIANVKKKTVRRFLTGYCKNEFESLTKSFIFIGFEKAKRETTGKNARCTWGHRSVSIHNKTPKGIMRSAVTVPCFFDVLKSQRVAGQRPQQGTKSCRMGRNSVRPSARPSVRPPLAGPQTLLADPQTLLAGPQTLRAS